MLGKHWLTIGTQYLLVSSLPSHLGKTFGLKSKNSKSLTLWFSPFAMCSTKASHTNQLRSFTTVLASLKLEPHHKQNVWEKWMHQMSSKSYTNGGSCHNLNICKVFGFLVSASSSPGSAFQILLLPVPPAPSAQLKVSDVAHLLQFSSFLLSCQ